MLAQGYQISTDKNLLDVAAIHAYLTRSYWSEGVPIEIVNKAIQHSLCFGVYYQGEQVGFARLITDTATFAYLADVYILEEHRKKGLSKAMMKEIINHPHLQGLRRIALATADAHKLYEQFGFKALAKPETFMELWTPNIYKSQAFSCANG